MEQAGLLNSLTVNASTRVQAPATARAWSVGQILSATVLTAGTGGAPSTLQLSGESVQAHSRSPLQAGQALRLQVTNLGPPAILQVVTPPLTEDAPALAARVLRTALPQERPLAESLTVLQRVSDQPYTRRSGNLPHAARALLSDLLASFPRPRDAGDGARLAAMVRSCGLFHEAELARSTSQSSDRAPVANDVQGQTGADFKARIAAVAEALRQAVEAGAREGPVKEADSALRAVLARIETNQALSARGAQEQGAMWRMDLPFTDQRGPQAVGLRIHREDGAERSDGNGDTEWVVQLDVHPPGSAPLHARVSLSAGEVHTLFTTQDAATLSRLNDRSGELERRLEGEALQVGGVRSRLAAPPVDQALGRVDGLVDERA